MVALPSVARRLQLTPGVMRTMNRVNRLVIPLAACSWLLFLLALFMPALHEFEAWQVELPGWAAAALAFGSYDDFEAMPLTTVITVGASFTNLVALVSPWVVLRRRSVKALFIAVCIALAVDTGVYIVWHKTATFGPGYVAWLGGFVLLAAALLLAWLKPSGSQPDESHNYRLQPTDDAPSSRASRSIRTLRAAGG